MRLPASLRRGLELWPELYRDPVLPCGLGEGQALDLMYRDLTPEDFETLSKLDEAVPKTNILREGAASSLPRVLARECASAECGVCLAELAPESQAVQLPCRHAFHPECISKWLTQCKRTCPLCSAVIDEDTPSCSTAAPLTAAMPAAVACQ